MAWPLTGRSEELRVIETATSAPGLSGIIVGGTAGVGKSRVVREALSVVASNGCETRWAVGTSSARALPLGAFAPWVGSADAEGRQLVHLVRGVIDSLTAASPGNTSVVVAVDDAHLLDDLSAFVLHQIVQRGAAKVVLTVRDGESIPDGVQEVWKVGQFDRLDLQPLSRKETTALVSLALGGPLDPDAARRLWDMTRGNVLYLRNIVEQEIADQRLANQDGLWRWAGDPVVSPGLVKLIESRIGALPTAVGEVTDVLAVAEPIELASLRRITDPAAIEEADRRGLITLDQVNEGMEVRLAHPLYGEVRRRRAPSTALRRLRGKVATELVASDSADDMRILVRRATLTLESDLQPDPHLLGRAAQWATWYYDMPLAERLADAAIRAGAGAEAVFVRAYALIGLNRGQEADALVTEMPSAELSDADRARVALLRATNRLWALADPEGAKKLIDDAAQTIPSSARGCIDAFHIMYWATMGKPEASRESTTNLALDDLPDVVAAGTARLIAIASGDAGRTTDAVAAADAGYAVATRSFDAGHMRLLIADSHVGALLLAGRMRDAGEVAERMRQQGAEFPGEARLTSVAVAGLAAYGAGRLREACSLLGLVIDVLYGAEDTVGWVCAYQMPRTIALAMCGSTKEAVAALAAAERHTHPSWRSLDYQRGLARAWVAACQGAVSKAIGIALSAAEIARTNGQFAAEVMCLQAATQFGDLSGAPRLHELESIVEGPRVGVAARFAAAMHDGDGAELATVSEEFEAMGDLVAAVDAAAHAALAYRRQDLRGSALGCSTRAEALAERCGGASTPALRQAAERLPLTDREREIVMLLGEGLSSREVAERLFVSVRTVETHIYRAMAKTGTTNREELAALIPRPKPGPG